MQSGTKIIASITLAVVLSALIVALRKPSPVPGKAFQDSFWLRKTWSNEKYPVLIGGDSRVYRGVNPVDLAKAADIRSAFNMGFSSQGFSMEYLDLLESRLDMQSSEKVIVLGVTPYSFTPKALANKHLKEFSELKTAEKYEMLYLSRITDFFAPFRFSKLVRTLDGIPAPDIYRESYTEEGWVSSVRLKIDSSEAAKLYVREFDQNTIDDRAITALVQRVNRWVNQGIRVYAFKPPIPLSTANVEDSISGFDYASFIQNFNRAGGIWLEVGPHYTSYDGSHIDSSSAILLSRHLGEAIHRNTAE